MAADMFSRRDATNLLDKKRVLMFGDSNMRAIYKDLIWLLEEGTLLPAQLQKIKNELSHAGDMRISDGKLTTSRNYIEIREYNKVCFVHYEFITRLFSEGFQKTINELKFHPDFIIINSCVWDLSRWGPNGIAQFKKNLEKTMEFLRCNCRKSCIIFTTTLPPSVKARGGFLTENIQFLRDSLPLNVVEANHYCANLCKKYQVDIIDLHYHLRFMIDYREPDGIHWEPMGIRYITNIILTHLAVCTHKQLPGNVPLLYNYNMSSHNDEQNNNTVSVGASTSKNDTVLKNKYKRRRTIKRTNRINPDLYDVNYYRK